MSGKEDIRAALKKKLLLARNRASNHAMLDCLDGLEDFIENELAKAKPRFPPVLLDSVPGTVTKRQWKQVLPS